MFSGNMGLHILKNPKGTFSYVGSIPVVLGTKAPATKSDILGCRSFVENDQSWVWKFPTFETYQEALNFAESKGCTVIAPAQPKNS